MKALSRMPAHIFNFCGYCVRVSSIQRGFASNQNLQSCRLALPFIWKIVLSENTMFDKKLGSLSILSIINSQNSMRLSKSSSFNSYTRWTILGWNLLFFNILSMDFWLSCCRNTLRLESCGFSIKDCRTSNLIFLDLLLILAYLENRPVLYWTIFNTSNFVEMPYCSFNYRSWNDSIFITKSFIKKLSYIIVRSQSIVPGSHNQKKYVFSFRKT